MRRLLSRIYSKLPFRAREFLRGVYLNFPIATTAHVNRIYRKLNNELELTRSRIDVPPELVMEFTVAKDTPEFLAIYDKPEPLVSVCIPTWNRGQILTERTIPALLNQTYKNIEVIVVGDCCTDNTDELMKQIDDPRVQWLNLPEKGDDMPECRQRWAIAGTVPANTAMEMSRGEFICHCDDDDAFVPEKIEKLVAFMQEHKPHFIWHDFYQQLDEGGWENRRCYWLELGYIVTSSIFYHNWFKRVPFDIEAWRFGEPGDYNLVRRLKYLGVDFKRYPEPLLYKYKGTTQFAD